MLGITPYRRHRNEEVDVYNPWRALEEFERNFWDRSNDNLGFKVDIKDNGDAYVLEADMPGFDKKDIKIDIENGYLTISGERKNEVNEKDDKGNYLRMERSYGSFSRSFDVSNVNEDDIKAEYTNGVLKLNLPKKTEIKPSSRRLEIE